MSDAILVIKLGALGDFLQSAGPFAAIRQAHPDDEITLLTTAPFAALAEAAPWFDQIWPDDRPSGTNVGGWWTLRRRLRGGQFKRVYDLQTSDRSGFYHRLFWPGPRPEWSGIAPGCSHPHANTDRDFMHTLDRQREQLVMAGIEQFSDINWSWISDDLARFDLGDRFALLVPGGARHRPAKRWPIENYVALAKHLATGGIRPVIIGTADEKDLAAEIILAEPDARDLTGATNLTDLLALAGAADCAIGNDTGPMHAVAMRDRPSIVLFSNESDPNICAPRGAHVTVIHRPDLHELSSDEVIKALPA